MSGHSKWANIKHRKAKTDAQKGKIFTRLTKELMMAVKQGGADPAGNARLRLAIDKARAGNLPNERIHRAIEKASGGGEGAQLEEMTCEGYGPDGVAILVEAVTDNRNRTIPELRTLFTRNGGNMGEVGCVAWMFQEKGIVRIAGGKELEEALTDKAAELEAEDITWEEDHFEVTVPPLRFEAMCQGLSQAGFNIASSEVAKLPQTYISVSQEQGEAIMRLLAALEEHEDVQNVYANVEVMN